MHSFVRLAVLEIVRSTDLHERRVRVCFMESAHFERLLKVLVRQFTRCTLLYARICTSGVPEVTKYTLLPINFWDEFVFDPNHQTMSRIARKPEVIDKNGLYIHCSISCAACQNLRSYLFERRTYHIWIVCGGGGGGEKRM